MKSHKPFSLYSATVVGQAVCLLGLGGCIMGPNRPDSGATAVSSHALTAAARQSGTNPNRDFGDHEASRSECRGGAGWDDYTARVLLAENWNGFDTSVWSGDGDQSISDGKFTAREGAESAAADWNPGAAGALPAGQILRFANVLVSNPNFSDTSSPREALFFVSGDVNRSYQNYLFVSVRYSVRAESVSVESFGASGGVEFDQVVDKGWIPPSDLRLQLEVDVEANAYRILLDGAALDSVALGRALGGVTVFEVGVQRNPEGTFGLIDQTTVTLETLRIPGRIGGHPGDPNLPDRHHRAGNPAHRRACLHLAKEKLAHCAHPSRGLEALSRMRD